MLGDNLIIRHYPAKQAGVAQIRSHIMMCRKIGFFPDVIIVDYLDLLKAPRRRSAKREELTDIAEELKGLASELKIGIWTATQSRREAISMETHTEEQVGEDIGKMNTADLVITLNQTTDEVYDKVMRLFVAKNRNGPKYMTIKIANDFDRMCFFDPIATAELQNPEPMEVPEIRTSVKSRRSVGKPN
jgi:replicative DNA helicase